MIVAFLESALNEAKDIEATTGMDLYFVSTKKGSICRIYYKFFNDIDAATRYFFVEKNLRIINTSIYTNCLMRFAYNLKFIVVYDIEQVFRTIETYKLLELPE
jgi:hypothetical protein